MMAPTIGRQDLRDWLHNIARDRLLIAPVQMEGAYYFRAVRSADEVALDYTQSTVSPKEWFFPRADTLFTVVPRDGSVALEPPGVPGRRVLFGIRPCDARALAVLDRPFLMEPADNLYQERRANTILVGLACSAQPFPECFCTSLGGGPHEAEHVDLLLVESGDGYTATAVTDKGRELLAEAALGESREVPPPPQIANVVPTAGAAERLRLAFDDPYWQRLADRCLGCKMCTFLCPTCHCFDIRDCQVEGSTERVRCWDGCQSSHFTRLAGGHNPRGKKAARLRQYYAHKYLYFPERFGVVQCVGCGRCAHFCPVNIDIRETLAELHDLEVKLRGS